MKKAARLPGTLVRCVIGLAAAVVALIGLGGGKIRNRRRGTPTGGKRMPKEGL